MGFGREARRVLDESLPFRFCLHSLGSCIQLAQPIGFNATWSYLQDKLERPWRDPEILIPAIELLEAERTLHLRVDAEYAALRRDQKASGLRYPPRTHVTPRDPARWHGDERLGAWHNLDTWWRLRRRLNDDVAVHAHGRLVVDAVARMLRGGPQAADPDMLQAALDWARRQVHVVGWEADPDEYRVAWAMHHLLGQLHLLGHGAPAVATPWNFGS